MVKWSIRPCHLQDLLISGFVVQMDTSIYNKDVTVLHLHLYWLSIASVWGNRAFMLQANFESLFLTYVYKCI